MRDSRSQFISLAVFLAVVGLLLGNGFSARIFAQPPEEDIFRQIQPIGNVLDEIRTGYVHEPEIEDIVEGAIIGMMNSLDEHSSYIPKRAFELMTEDTDGEFEGIGVTIHLNENRLITVFQPIAGAPAAEAGVMAGDIIAEIDGVSTKGMSLDQARDLIRGPGGTVVNLTLIRPYDEPVEDEDPIIEVSIKRGTIPLWSIDEARVLDGGIGYIRVSDFKKTTAHELAEKIEELRGEGMKSLVLDLRWNPGGLLTASKEVAELFLPQGTLVTYTRGRGGIAGPAAEEMRLRTERSPVVPDTFPIVVLVNEHTASSSEIVTGALQYWSRALVVGVKTYGKGSVQTIIPLARPEGSAIRLTTALYYTPGDVTIDKQGILPDVEAPMSREEWRNLLIQMADSYRNDPDMRNRQNHGSVTGNEVTEDTVEDVQLLKAVELLRSEPVFHNLLARHHRDTRETQRAASAEPPEAAAVEPPADQSSAVVPQ